MSNLPDPGRRVARLSLASSVARSHSSSQTQFKSKATQLKWLLVCALYHSRGSRVGLLLGRASVLCCAVLWWSIPLLVVVYLCFLLP